MLLGGTPVSLPMCRGMWPWIKVPPQGCGQTGRVGTGQSQTSQSCSAPAKMRNASSNVQGSLPRSATWVLAHVQRLPGHLRNPHSSICLGPCAGADLPPADTVDVHSLPDWTHSSYRLCSIREQISFALFSLRKKGVCFVCPCKCQKHKILKTLSKKLISLLKRAIEKVILLSYCLMNLLSPVFSAQKWVLTCLRQGEVFPFVYCSISSYQSHSWKS